MDSDKVIGSFFGSFLGCLIGTLLYHGVKHIYLWWIGNP